MSHHRVYFGPDTGCTLAKCPVEDSIYTYRPSLAANASILALFALSMLIHAFQGVKYRTWAFLFCCAWGCIAEIIGYVGRIMLWQNPFSFNGFLIQIICITLGAAFFSAATYLTLYRIVLYLGPQYSRFSPRFFYWLFIPCDIISLTLQGTGGGLSSVAGSGNGNTKIGVNVSLAGLAFQVFTLLVFIVLAVDYFVRYSRGTRAHPSERKFTTRFRIFLGFLTLSILCIFIRCAYRIDELSDGYTGSLFHDQWTFVGLEGVMILVAVFSLNIAHPGPVFKGTVAEFGQAQTKSARSSKTEDFA